MTKPIILGAVLYDPKVSVIWDIIREYFEDKGVPMDVVFFTNYELQVESLINGHGRGRVELAARVGSTQCVVRAASVARSQCATPTATAARTSSPRRARASPRPPISKARRFAFGAKDSPQARLIPIQLLNGHGLKHGTDYTAKRFDVLVGKHGDHIGGELDAFSRRSMRARWTRAACSTSTGKGGPRTARSKPLTTRSWPRPTSSTTACSRCSKASTPRARRRSSRRSLRWTTTTRITKR